MQVLAELNTRFRVLLVLGFVLSSGANARAARLLVVDFQIDGQTFLRAPYTDSDAYRGTPLDTPAAWRLLAEPPGSATTGEQDKWIADPQDATKQIRVTEKLAALPVDEDDPLRAKLDGDITISLRHAGDTLAQAKISQLTLIREDDRSNLWHLPREEVERTAKAAGLPQPSTWAAIRRKLSVFYDILPLLAIVVVGWIVLRLYVRRRRKSYSA